MSKTPKSKTPKSKTLKSKTTKSKTTKSKTAMPDALSVRAAQEFAVLAFYAGCGFREGLGPLTFEFEEDALNAWLNAQTKSLHDAIDVRQLTNPRLLATARATAVMLGNQLGKRGKARAGKSRRVMLSKSLVKKVVDEFRKSCRPGGGGGAYCAFGMEA